MNTHKSQKKNPQKHLSWSLTCKNSIFKGLYHKVLGCWYRTCWLVVNAFWHIWIDPSLMVNYFVTSNTQIVFRAFCIQKQLHSVLKSTFSYTALKARRMEVLQLLPSQQSNCEALTERPWAVFVTTLSNALFKPHVKRLSVSEVSNFFQRRRPQGSHIPLGSRMHSSINLFFKVYPEFLGWFLFYNVFFCIEKAKVSVN